MQISNNYNSQSFGMAFKIHPVGQYFVRQHAQRPDLELARQTAELAKDSKNYDIVLGNGTYYIKNKNNDVYIGAPTEAHLDNEGRIIVPVPVRDNLWEGEGTGVRNKVLALVNRPNNFVYAINNAKSPYEKLLVLFRALEDPQFLKFKEETENLRMDLLNKYC